MPRTTPASIAAVFAFALVLFVPSGEPSAQTASQGVGVSAREAEQIAREAYIYAYPLVLMDVTRQQLTNFVEPTGKPGQGPANQFIHQREFLPVEFKVVIRANVDTLYSSAWLDLAKEPVVLSVPATNRYFMLPMLSMWSDVFAVPGTRTTGADTARTFLVTGPGWNGAIPEGMERIQSPTRYVWFIGRTQANGKDDYANVHEIQKGIKLTLLSGWGEQDYAPPKGQVDPSVDMKTPPPAQVDQMDAATFFARFAELLKDNPPNPVDYPTIHRLERVGIKLGDSFDLNSASSEIRQAFSRGTDSARALLAEEFKKVSGDGRGWTYRIGGGAFGVDYLFRATIAMWGLGYNLPEDAVYPSISTDGEGNSLDGGKRYVLHFEKDRWPPVSGFWSVTAYDAEGYFIPNALERQAIGDRDKLVPNADGSLDLYVQAESPGGDKEANWLPVAAGEPFTLMLRLYYPKPEILDLTWTPPPVKAMQ